MGDKKTDLSQALREALDFERKGSEFYVQLGIDTKQPLAKRLFYNLAKQEIDHIVRIEEIFDALKRNTPWPEFKAKDIREIEQEMKKIFGSLDKKARAQEPDNKDGYQLAINLEKQGYEMYRKFSGKATDEREQRFFSSLAEEEKNHLTALDNVYYFLTQSEEWLSMDESRVWNWMAT